MATEIKLLTGPHCHLCEQAKSILSPVKGAKVGLQEINVRDDELLFDAMDCNPRCIIC